MTVVCETVTEHTRAFGTLAFGIGTSEVEHVLATHACRRTNRATMLIDISGALPKG